MALKIVVVGHVDHGKSTLIGRIFHDADALPEGRLEKLEGAARRRGVAFEFANLTDGLQAERDRNITIDTTQVVLGDGERAIVFIDAPGHREFLKNMVTGAAQADAALLVIDIDEGLSEQTRRHAFLVSLLGVSQVLVVINKLDNVGASDDREPRFHELRAAAGDLLTGLGLSVVATIPVSASLGWNVVRHSTELPWYRGPAVLEALRQMGEKVVATASGDDETVFAIQDVYRTGAGRVVVGRVEKGLVQSGQTLTAWPSQQSVTVESADSERSKARGSEYAAGDAAAFTVKQPVFLARGNVLASPGAPIGLASRLRARLFWLGQTPLITGQSYLLRLGTQDAIATVSEIESVVDSSTLAEIPDRSSVPSGGVAEVRMTLTKSLIVCPTGEIPELERFVLIDRQSTGRIQGGGLVMSTTALATNSAEPLALAERLRTWGHRGAVVWFTGLSGAGKTTLARQLERALFDHGLHVAVLDGDDVRLGLNAGLTFSREDRRENIRRAAEVARLMAMSGVVVIAAFISPYVDDRDHARAIVTRDPAMPFSEVFLDADVATCEERDPKGLYGKARRGEIENFTGVSAPYERPPSPDVTIRSGSSTVPECLFALMSHVFDTLLAGPDA